MCVKCQLDGKLPLDEESIIDLRYICCIPLPQKGFLSFCGIDRHLIMRGGAFNEKNTDFSFDGPVYCPERHFYQNLTSY